MAGSVYLRLLCSAALLSVGLTAHAGFLGDAPTPPQQLVTVGSDSATPDQAAKKKAPKAASPAAAPSTPSVPQKPVLPQTKAVPVPAKQGSPSAPSAPSAPTTQNGQISSKTLEAEQALLKQMHVQPALKTASAPTPAISAAARSAKSDAMLREFQGLDPQAQKTEARLSSVKVPSQAPVSAPAQAASSTTQNRGFFVPAEQSRAIDLSQQLRRLQADNQMYRTGVSLQMNSLAQQNQGLQQKLQTLYARLQEQEQQGGAQVASYQHPAVNHAAFSFTAHEGFYALAVLLILLLLGGLFLWIRPSTKAARPALGSDGGLALDAQGEEYDYMGSAEGVGTKLDLVRAYIAMEDKVSAVKSLNEVLKVGNVAQCREARALLKQLISNNA